MATIKCSNRNIFVDINALKRSEYFRPVLFNALSFKGSGLLTGLQGMGPGKLFYPDLRTLDFGVFFSSHVVLGLNFWKTLASFHINARKQFNNNLTFDYTGYSSKIVQVLLDGLHLEIPGLPTAVKNLPDMLELILFLLDDGKIR